MVSPVQKKTETEKCLTFYYFLVNIVEDANINQSSLNLSVYILPENQRKVTPAWTAVNGNTLFWEYATVSISLKEAYRYSFVASKSDKSVPLFYLDDISVQNGPCPQKLSCTFANGSLCGWTTSFWYQADGTTLTWLAKEPYLENWLAASSTAENLEAKGMEHSSSLDDW